MSVSGYRVMTPKTPADIVELISAEKPDALVVNNSVDVENRRELLERVRAEFPNLLIIHVYTRGEQQVERLADANVDVTDPTNLIFALEKLLSADGDGREEKLA
jgi:hypothetical protein